MGYTTNHTWCSAKFFPQWHFLGSPSYDPRYPYKTVTDTLDAASNMSARQGHLHGGFDDTCEVQSYKNSYWSLKMDHRPKCFGEFLNLQSLHPRKLTAGGPQNHGSENVFPFKYGDFWYLCQISGVYLLKFRRKMMELARHPWQWKVCPQHCQHAREVIHVL